MNSILKRPHCKPDLLRGRWNKIEKKNDDAEKRTVRVEREQGSPTR